MVIVVDAAAGEVKILRWERTADGGDTWEQMLNPFDNQAGVAGKRGDVFG